MSQDAINKYTAVGMDGGLELFLRKAAMAEPDRQRVCFLCIGSDRSTGDSFGPLVGTLLKANGWPRVIGTLEQPCDANAVEEACRETALFQAQGQGIVIAIDACLGKPLSVGKYLVAEGPLQPGAATRMKLPHVGDYSIAGVVNLNGPKAYAVLQSTSLASVLGMAGSLATFINNAWNVGSSRAESGDTNTNTETIAAMLCQ
ncbi:spore protease YyaC [Paenibacillus sp. CAU 1782]